MRGRHLKEEMRGCSLVLHSSGSSIHTGSTQHSHSVDHRGDSRDTGAARPLSGISKHTQTQKLCQDQGHSPLCSQNRCIQHHSRTK